MNLPTEISTDARAVAEWLVANHSGQVIDLNDGALIDDIASVLAEFRAAPAARVGLTKTQAAALHFLGRYIAANGYSPTYEEIAAGLGIRHKSKVCYLIGQLEERGFVRRVPNRSRSIALVGRA